MSNLRGGASNLLRSASAVAALTDELALRTEMPRPSTYGCRAERPEDLLEGFRRMEEGKAGT